MKKPSFKINDLIRLLIKFYFWIPSRVIPIQNLIQILFDLIKRGSGTIPTYELLNFNAEINKFDTGLLGKLSIASDVGIVIQGPIRNEFNFTLQMVEYYLREFKCTEIVLSTWISEDLKLFREIESQYGNFHVVAQEKPLNQGISNINLQIASTFTGLRTLEDLGVKFAIKIRTDQCMFDKFAITKLKHLFDSENLNNNARKKIIILSLGTFLFRPYGPSDFFQFGSISDLLAFWDLPFDERADIDSAFKEKQFTLRQFAMAEMCEVYLAAHYFRLNGEVLDFSLKSSINMFKSYFIIIDPSHIGFIWDKYTSRSDRWRQSSFPKPYQEITNGLWLALQGESPDFASLDYLLDTKVEEGEFRQVTVTL